MYLLLLLFALSFTGSRAGFHDPPAVVDPPPTNNVDEFLDIGALNKKLLNATKTKLETEDGLFSNDEDDYHEKLDSMTPLMEEDIVVTQDLVDQIKILQSNDGMQLFDAISNGAWPNAAIPYTYAPGTSGRLSGAVNQAVAEYKRLTCIKWTYYAPGTIRSFRYYVTFFIGGGCYSMIGRQRGPQKISLGRGCESKGVAIHEMMHALGFFHEQSRRDRDQYIRINWGSIPQRVRYNFQKYRQGQADTLNEPYDKASIMHYGNYAFSNNRQMTIISKSNPNERLGQRRGLSKIDVKQLMKYYKCKGTTTTTTGGGGKDKNCKDRHTFCKLLGTYCGNTWVMTNCKKTCKKCKKPKPPPTNCRDSAQYCVSWGKAGYCRHTYVQYMKTNCKKTCRQC